MNLDYFDQPLKESFPDLFRLIVNGMAKVIDYRANPKRWVLGI